MTTGVVWKNKHYLGKGFVLQRANASTIKHCKVGTYEADPDPALTKVSNGEYIERWRVVHLSEIIENYEELEKKAVEKLGEEMIDE